MLQTCAASNCNEHVHCHFLYDHFRVQRLLLTCTMQLQMSFFKIGFHSQKKNVMSRSTKPVPSKKKNNPADLGHYRIIVRTWVCFWAHIQTVSKPYLEATDEEWHLVSGGLDLMLCFKPVRSRRMTQCGGPWVPEPTSYKLTAQYKGDKTGWYEIWFNKVQLNFRMDTF